MEEVMAVQRSVRRVLLVDDDPEFVARAAAIIASVADFRAVADAEAALTQNVLWRPDMIMLDALFGMGDSFVLLDELRQSRPGEHFAIICLARGRGASNHIEPFGDGVFGMLCREPDDEVLRDEVVNAVRKTDRLLIRAA
jgi:PleD family two-component response regulator